MPKKKKSTIQEIKLSLTDKRRLLRQAGYNSDEARNWGNRSNENVMKLVNQKRKQQGLNTLKPTAFLKSYKEELEQGKDWKSVLSDLFINKPEVQSGYKKPKKKELLDKRYPNETNLSRQGYKIYFAWREQTESFEGDIVLGEKIRSELTMTNEELINEINKTIPTDGGYIGQFRMEISKYPPNYNIEDMEDWTIVYGGNGKKLHTLLASMNAMVVCLYESWKKNDFIRELVQLMNTINPRTAKFIRDNIKYHAPK